MKLLNEVLQGYHPADEQWKDIAGALQKLSKHFPANSPSSPQPKMSTGSPMSSVPQPPMSGGPIGGMAPRGPIPGPQA
jgi:hypothetical protein